MTFSKSGYFDAPLFLRPGKNVFLSSQYYQRQLFFPSGMGRFVELEKNLVFCFICGISHDHLQWGNRDININLFITSLKVQM